MGMAQQGRTCQGGKSRYSEWRGTHDPSFLRGSHSPENPYQFDCLFGCSYAARQQTYFSKAFAHYLIQGERKYRVSHDLHAAKRKPYLKDTTAGLHPQLMTQAITVNAKHDVSLQGKAELPAFVSMLWEAEKSGQR